MLNFNACVLNLTAQTVGKTESSEAAGLPLKVKFKVSFRPVGLRITSQDY